MHSHAPPLSALILATRFAHRCGARAQGGGLAPPTRGAFCASRVGPAGVGASAEGSVHFPGGPRGGLPPLGEQGSGSPRRAAYSGPFTRAHPGGSPGGSPPRSGPGAHRPPLGHPPGGPPRDTPGTPPGRKFCTFRWVFNKSPIRDKHGTLFWDSFSPRFGTNMRWDKHAPWDTPQNTPPGTPPQDPPFT